MKDFLLVKNWSAFIFNVFAIKSNSLSLKKAEYPTEHFVEFLHTVMLLMGNITFWTIGKLSGQVSQGIQRLPEDSKFQGEEVWGRKL